MARFTLAYSSFVKRLEEVDILRALASEKEKIDAIKYRKNIDALSRGAIVLLCGHLEAYVKELGEIALDAIYSKSVSRAKVNTLMFYHISKDILDEIKDTKEKEKIADKVFALIERDFSYWSRTGGFPNPISSELFNKGFSNPAYEKIGSYFNRFGYLVYDRDIARKLRADYQTTKNMVDHLVDTRNKIAHGDPNATKTPIEVKEIVEIIKNFCSTTDSVFASWIKSTYCSIR